MEIAWPGNDVNRATTAPGPKAFAADEMPARRFAYLDGLRGIASVMVLLSHYIVAIMPAMLDGIPQQSHFGWDAAVAHTGFIFFYNPALGVDIFFVLSGFVLAFSIAGNRPFFPALVLRRWVRLCLPVFAIIPFIWLAFHAGAFHATQSAITITRSQWIARAYPNVLRGYPLGAFFYIMLFNFPAGSAGSINTAVVLIPTLWTLPIEFRGSIGLFVFYYLLQSPLRHSSWSIIAAALAIVSTWNSPYCGFGLGIALFEFWKIMVSLSETSRRRLRRVRPLLGAMVLSAGLWFSTTPFAPGGLHLLFSNMFHIPPLPLNMNGVFYLGAVLLVASVMLLNAMQKLLSAGFFQYLGRISFMLYLVQVPVLCSAPLWLLIHLNVSYSLRALAALAAYIFFSVIVADLSTRFIDTPSIYLSRLCTSRRPQPAVATSAGP